MKKQDILICAAVPVVTATALVLMSGGAPVLSALIAVCVALIGLMSSLVLTLLPLAKFLIIPALGIVTARFIHAVGKDTGSAHPTLCAAVSGACAMLLFSYLHPVTGLLAVIMSAVMWGIYRENKTDESDKWIVWVLAAVFGMLALGETSVANGKLAQAAVVHRMTAEELATYDAWLRDRYMGPDAEELHLREWAMDRGMTQPPLAQTDSGMVLDMPGEREDLVCRRHEDGRVDIEFLRHTKHATNIFLRRLCSLRIGKV